MAPSLGRLPPPHETIPRLPSRPTPARERDGTVDEIWRLALDLGVECHLFYVMAKQNLHGQLGQDSSTTLLIFTVYKKPRFRFNMVTDIPRKSARKI
jgi:hypothetical protein